MKTKRIKKPCVIEGCDRLQSAKGLCTAHYARQYHGRSLSGSIRIDKSGANNPKWRGGVIKDGGGRVLIYCPLHPYPNWGGKYVYRYRLVMEKVLGRFLLPDEIVHHVNGIKDDDVPENLRVMSQSQHCAEHFSKGDKWAIQADSCRRCDSTGTPHEAHGLCRNCYSKSRKGRRTA